MKKRKNILLVVVSLLLLAVTVYALVSGGDVVSSNLDTTAQSGILDDTLGMIHKSILP